MQTLLFSATMPSALHEFAKAGLKDPEMVRLDTDIRISQELSTAFFTVRCGHLSLLHLAPFNPEMSILSHKRHPYTENLNSEMFGDSKDVFLHCGDVLALSRFHSVHILV